MMKTMGTLSTLAVLLAVAMPLNADAQNANKPAAAAKAAAPQAARPAARAAPPAAAARPHVAAPARSAAPRAPQPRAAARPHAPRPQSAARQQHQPAARAVQQHQRAQSRQERTQERRQVQQSRPAQNNARAKAQTQTNAKTRLNAQTQTNAKAQPNAQTQQKLNSPQARRAERALRQAEQRELRALPPKQRAARREEIRRARAQRAQQQAARPNTAGSVQTNAQTRAERRAARRAARQQTRVTLQAARQGRFAGAYAGRAQARNARASHIAARRAWRHGHRAVFVAWYGPVFWPYAYSDIFDYTFWPGGYEPGYWAYAYDDFVFGLFWGEAGPREVYAYAAPSASAPAPRARHAEVQALCKQPGSGITAWPFAEIERKVGLNTDQKQLLGDVRDAGQKAASVFKASCPAENAFPLTPPGRLASMTERLGATLDAIRTVRPALEKFYDSLSDEQKERFNEIGPDKNTKTANNAEVREALSDEARHCSQAKPGLTNLPIEKIEDALDPNDSQQAELDRLGEATVKAVGILQAACPDETPLTPPGRLQAMETRLQAMIDAAHTVKPALNGFYGSLSSEQKARFNRLGRDLAKNEG